MEKWLYLCFIYVILTITLWNPFGVQNKLRFLTNSTTKTGLLGYIYLTIPDLLFRNTDNNFLFLIPQQVKRYEILWRFVTLDTNNHYLIYVHCYGMNFSFIQNIRIWLLYLLYTSEIYTDIRLFS